jgi:hypothetical protein
MREGPPVLYPRSRAGSTLEWFILGAKVFVGRAVLALIGPAILFYAARAITGRSPDDGQAVGTFAVLERAMLQCFLGGMLLAATTPAVAALLSRIVRAGGFRYTLTIPESARLTDHMYPARPLWAVYADRPRVAGSWEKPRSPPLPGVLTLMVLDLALLWVVGLPPALLWGLPVL